MHATGWVRQCALGRVESGWLAELPWLCGVPHHMAAQLYLTASSAFDMITPRGLPWPHKPHKLCIPTRPSDRAAHLTAELPLSAHISGVPRLASSQTAPASLFSRPNAVSSSTARYCSRHPHIETARRQPGGSCPSLAPAETSAPCSLQCRNGRWRLRQRAAAAAQQHPPPPLPPCAARHHPCSGSRCGSGTCCVQQQDAAAASRGQACWCSAARLRCSSSSNRCVSLAFASPAVLPFHHLPPPHACCAPVDCCFPVCKCPCSPLIPLTACLPAGIQ